MSVDKTKAFFMQDAMEILDREAEDYFDHDLFTKHLIKNQNYENERYVFKYVGNIVVAGKHVTKVQIDHKFNKIFDEKAELLL